MKCDFYFCLQCGSPNVQRVATSIVQARRTFSSPFDGSRVGFGKTSIMKSVIRRTRKARLDWIHKCWTADHTAPTWPEYISVSLKNPYHDWVWRTPGLSLNFSRIFSFVHQGMENILIIWSKWNENQVRKKFLYRFQSEGKNFIHLSEL